MKKILLFGFLLSASMQAQLVGGNFFTAINAENKCGANLSAGYFRNFMCYNLGADGTLDYTVPAAGLNGSYYQWGLSTALPASGGAWTAAATADDFWLDEGTKGPEDPCPEGFRLPSKKQWDGILAAGNNTIARLGAWANNSFTSVLEITADAATGKKLLLPTAGYRAAADGSLQNQGAEANYWTSTPNGAGNAFLLKATASSSPIASVASAARTQGASIRCIEDLKCRMRTGQTELGKKGSGLITDSYTTFMCHNLGADTNLDPDKIVEGIHGDYYQWGRKEPVGNSKTLYGSWNSSRVALITDWSEVYKTPLDPCPAGFYVTPFYNLQFARGSTSLLLGSINGQLNNDLILIGSWSETNTTSGIALVPDNVRNSKLTLPHLGYRLGTTGALTSQGNAGLSYWASSFNASSTNPYQVSYNFILKQYSGNTILPANTGLPVRCEEYPICRVRMSSNPISYKEWMCYNLGGSDNVDTNTHSVSNNGSYYQWGKKAAVATVVVDIPGTTKNEETDNELAIATVWSSVDAVTTWQGASKTTEDPCPAGFRVPTKTEWEAAIANNTLLKIGGWATNSGYGSSLYLMKDEATISLNLPAAGYRLPDTGALAGRASFGYYWSSSLDALFPSFASVLKIDGSNPSNYALIESTTKALGASVRCIKE